MAVTILKPQHYLPAPFTVPSSKSVLIDMESSLEVDLFVLLNEQELEAFKQGQRPYHRAAFNIRQFYSKLNLASLGAPVVPFQPAIQSQFLQPAPNPQSYFQTLLASSAPLPGSTWYLVIASRQSTADVAIYYRVYNA